MLLSIPAFYKIATEWIDLEVLSEVDVILTFDGYAPYLNVRKIKTGEEFRFYITAKSLAIPLEELRNKNNGIFEGIKFRVRKEGLGKTAKYEIEPYEGNHAETKLSEDVTSKLEEILS